MLFFLLRVKTNSSCNAFSCSGTTRGCTRNAVNCVVDVNGPGANRCTEDIFICGTVYGIFNTECIGAANSGAATGLDGDADDDPDDGASASGANNTDGSANGEPTRPDDDPDDNPDRDPNGSAADGPARGFDNDPDCDAADDTNGGADTHLSCALYITSLPPPIVAASGATAALLLSLTLVLLTSDAPPTLALVFLDAGTLPKFSLSLSGKKTDRGL